MQIIYALVIPALCFALVTYTIVKGSKNAKRNNDQNDLFI